MAITPVYDHALELSLKKLTVNGSVYWLKDEDLRNFVSTFGTVVMKDVETTFTENGANIATSAAIAEWVKKQIKEYQGVMHFRGVLEKTSEAETDLNCIDRLITDPASGDIVVIKDNGSEYVYYNSIWTEIGDQSLYLTQTTADTKYVSQDTTVAGLKLNTNISTTALSTALDIKALAHLDSANLTIEIPDSANDITVGKPGTYTFVSTDEVEVPLTFAPIEYLPKGTVDINAATAAGVTYDKAKSASISTSNADDPVNANYTPSGSISLPNIATTVSLTSEAIKEVTDEGTPYSITAGSVTKANDETAKFAKKTLKVDIDATDSEQLNLTYVENTDTEFYADAVTVAGDITYTQQHLTGSLPAFQTKNVVTGLTSASSTYDGTASFSGDGAIIAATIKYETTDANVTQPTYTATFTGEAKTYTHTAATSAKVPTAGNITVPSELLNITLNKKNQTVTIS